MVNEIQRILDGLHELSRAIEQSEEFPFLRVIKDELSKLPVSVEEDTEDPADDTRYLELFARVEENERKDRERVDALALYSQDESDGVLLDPEALDTPPPMFIITSSTQDSTNYRWVYQAYRLKKGAAGYDGWDNLATESYTLYNTLEDMNGASGLLGTGVDTSSLDTADWTFELQPCPVGAIVEGVLIPVSLTQAELDALPTDENPPDPEWWFEYSGSPDGECD